MYPKGGQLVSLKEVNREYIKSSKFTFGPAMLSLTPRRGRIQIAYSFNVSEKCAIILFVFLTISF